MNTSMHRIAGMAVLTLGLVLVAFSQPAAAAHGGGSIGVQFGGGRYYAPAVEQRYIPGHYEVRCETVLVEPEHHVRQWVPPVVETRHRHGHSYQVEVSPGYYQDVCVPARFEKRETRVWIPGFYESVPVATYQPEHRPRFSIRGFFGF